MKLVDFEKSETTAFISISTHCDWDQKNCLRIVRFQPFSVTDAYTHIAETFITMLPNEPTVEDAGTGSVCSQQSEWMFGQGVCTTTPLLHPHVCGRGLMCRYGNKFPELEPERQQRSKTSGCQWAGHEPVYPKTFLRPQSQYGFR